MDEEDGGEKEEKVASQFMPGKKKEDKGLMKKNKLGGGERELNLRG